MNDTLLYSIISKSKPLSILLRTLTYTLPYYLNNWHIFDIIAEPIMCMGLGYSCQLSDHVFDIICKIVSSFCLVLRKFVCSTFVTFWKHVKNRYWYCKNSVMSYKDKTTNYMSSFYSLYFCRFICIAYQSSL